MSKLIKQYEIADRAAAHKFMADCDCEYDSVQMQSIVRVHVYIHEDARFYNLFIIELDPAEMNGDNFLLPTSDGEKMGTLAEMEAVLAANPDLQSF